MGRASLQGEPEEAEAPRQATPQYIADDGD
jgi:hypothetical protein